MSQCELLNNPTKLLRVAYTRYRCMHPGEVGIRLVALLRTDHVSFSGLNTERRLQINTNKKSNTVGFRGAILKE